MNGAERSNFRARTHDLLLGVEGCAATWIARDSWRGVLEPACLIVLGGSAYGAAMGAWRAPLLAAYVAIKLPLLLLATACVDALVNGLWARRFGFELGFAQSLRAVLASFALAAIILGALAPVVLFFALALAGPDDASGRTAHDLLGVGHVVFIALAGTIAVARQKRWLAESQPTLHNAHVLAGVWLTVNLLVGAQISWNLRPWFGTPGLDVAFLRPDPFDGTFYESLLRMISHS